MHWPTAGVDGPLKQGTNRAKSAASTVPLQLKSAPIGVQHCWTPSRQTCNGVHGLCPAVHTLVSHDSTPVQNRPSEQSLSDTQGKHWSMFSSQARPPVHGEVPALHWPRTHISMPLQNNGSAQSASPHQGTLLAPTGPWKTISPDQVRLSQIADVFCHGLSLEDHTLERCKSRGAIVSFRLKHQLPSLSSSTLIPNRSSLVIVTPAKVAPRFERNS